MKRCLNAVTLVALGAAQMPLAAQARRTLREELVGTWRLVAYCGAYETDEARHVVLHHVEADRAPQTIFSGGAEEDLVDIN